MMEYLLMHTFELIELSYSNVFMEIIIIGWNSQTSFSYYWNILTLKESPENN